MRKILFLGQKPVAEVAWDHLRRGEGGGYRVAAVCSNRQAESVWWQSNRIHHSSRGIPFIDNSSRNEQILIDTIRQCGIDTIVCMQHPWILSGDVLASVGYNALNFHHAKLPDYRGYNAVNHAILNREEKFTCTMHWMTDEVDRGEIALEATFDITAADTAISLYAKSHVASLRLFERLISLLGGSGEIPRRPMAGAGRFYSRQSIEPLREIKDFSGDEAEVKARAFFFPPFEPAFLGRRGGKLYVLPPCLKESGFDVKPLGALETMIEAVGKDFSCEIQ
ncbi:MAG: hypothetical protein M3348_14965 [Acidobacteriota bacterium]|nr:hypothetical protein [Acidobacteriota bacterium]